MGFFTNRADVTYSEERGRCATPKGAEKSRLQMKAEKHTDDGKEERIAKARVWTLDKGCCRWCGRRVQRVLDLIPERAEFHHVSGRIIRAIRWDIRNLLLLCASCHERITGKVAERFLIHSRHTFTVDGIKYINARKPVLYQRVA